MFLASLITIVAGLISVRIIKTVQANSKSTTHLSQSSKRKLMWRYGPYLIDEHTIAEHSNMKPGKGYTVNTTFNL